MIMYWKQDDTGTMQEIIMKFLKDSPLNYDELRILRDYIFNYAGQMKYKPDDLERIYQLNQKDLKHYVYYTLFDVYGIDVI